MKIAIAGTGYVGLSNAILLSQHHKVTAVDVIQEKVDMVNRKESPIVDDYIKDYLAHKDLDLTATMDGDSAYRDADLIVIAAPTNYDTETNHFDTSAVEAHPLPDPTRRLRGHRRHQIHHPDRIHPGNFRRLS